MLTTLPELLIAPLGYYHTSDPFILQCYLSYKGDVIRQGCQTSDPLFIVKLISQINLNHITLCKILVFYDIHKNIILIQVTFLLNVFALFFLSRNENHCLELTLNILRAPFVSK